MRKIVLFTAVYLTTINVFCQQQPDFRPPMDIPLLLSGNFGELRSNHFHSGIDFKTQGVTGHKIFAIASGYVSRIKVQTGGYGKALYIAHPGGYTSVYGHLEDYNGTIGNYVRDLQYQRQSHGFDLYLQPGEIEVSKGEVIAYSGNTGSSSGPHLHFEIRRTSDQHPLNGLLFNFPIEDDLPPRILKAAIYPLDESSHVDNASEPLYLFTRESDNVTRLAGHNPIKVNGQIGFGIEVYDYLNGAPNRCGVFSLDLEIDGKQVFYSEMNEFSFAESRFINAHIDYALKHKANRNVQRLFKLPYNELSIYKFADNDGAVNISDTLVREVRITATDSYGNSSSLAFQVKGTGGMQTVNNDTPGDPGPVFTGHTVPFNEFSSYSKQNIELRFPAYSFYDHIDFTVATFEGPDAMYSDIYQLHDEAVPVHRAFDISLVPDRLPVRYPEKLCLVSIEEDGSFKFAGGDFTDGKVTGQLRSFGKYAIGIDTVAPEITPLDLYAGKDLSTQPGIRFSITDDLSGIDSYNGYINGQWVLFEYDPKNNLLFHEFDGRVPFSGKNNELEIELKDAKGNTTNYHTTFLR